MTQCEYFLIEYVASPRAELRVPIGLVLLEESGRLVRCGMTRNWKTIRCLDARADLALLGTLSSWIEQFASERAASGINPGRHEVGEQDLRSALIRLAESNLGTVQIAPAQGVETENPMREFDVLFEEHVERPRPASLRQAPRAGSRPWIQARLQEALERNQLLDRLRHPIPVEEFTAPGDGFRIDYAYRPNGITKYIHALSLENDWNQSKVLSYTFGKIRERGPAALTAIVADADPDHPRAQSCRRILTDSEIAIQPISGLDRMLGEIRQELGPVA